MPSHLYILVLPEKDRFKIGVTNNLHGRIAKLQSIWGKFDLASSLTVDGPPRDVSLLEKTLHYAFAQWNLQEVKEGDGRTEWFHISCLDSVLEMITLHIKLREHRPMELVKGIVARPETARKPFDREAFLVEKQRRYAEACERDLLENKEKLERFRAWWPNLVAVTTWFGQHPSHGHCWDWRLKAPEDLIDRRTDIFWLSFNYVYCGVTVIGDWEWRKDQQDTEALIRVCVAKPRLSAANMPEVLHPFLFEVSELFESLEPRYAHVEPGPWQKWKWSEVFEAEWLLLA